MKKQGAEEPKWGQRVAPALTRRNWVVGALGFAAGVFVTILLERVYARGGFLKDTLDSVTRPPITPTKILFYVAALLILVALPLAIAEWASERRYVRAEREMRAARPAAAVTRYEGPDGRGFLFDGPEGRALLLEPRGGIGAPTVVDLPPVPAEPLADDAQSPLRELR